MFNTKRAMVVGGGVLAITASTVITVAAGPARPMTPSWSSVANTSSVALSGQIGTFQGSSRSGSASITLNAPAADASQQTLSASTSTNAASTATSAASRTTPSASSKSRGQGNSFGQFISSVARATKGARDGLHGALISFFATALNHGHNNSHAHSGATTNSKP